MESQNSHRRERTTSDFFLCFTSRATSSSSSMRISSKSILSPGRTDKFREPTFSLSTSLSRRLRNNGSMKGGQASPMFPAGSKKRGCAFENPEPSSPKVTCIGQVRVKTKKQGRKMRTRSKRKGDVNVSFRRTEQNQDSIIHHSQQQDCLPYRNQRWVHLPLTICEALRAFGAEFNCFLPCRSSCSSTNAREKEEKTSNSTTGTNARSCGAVFARWLMTMQEGEEKRREMDLEVREREKRDESVTEVIDEIHIEEEKGEFTEEAEEEEEKRVSICIPPKNALLLMRCRSDPARMSSLANRFWESPARKDESEDEFEEDGNEEETRNQEDDEEKEEKPVDNVNEELEMSVKCVSDEVIPETEENPLMEETLEIEEQNEGVEETQNMQGEDEEVEEEKQDLNVTEEIITPPADLEEPVVPEEEPKLKEEENEEEKKERRASFSSSITESVQSAAQEEEEPEIELHSELLTETALKEETEESMEEKVTELIETQDSSATESIQKEKIQEKEEEEEEEELKSIEREKDSSLLPDCLLLMMCEPKLSMEVSKETWVCSTDFIRWRPDMQKVIPINGGDEIKKSISMNSNPAPQQQPPRSSFSNLAPTSEAPLMATVIEQKLVNATVYEPFVLKRCKSEPVRSSAKLAPEACSWKNSKLESHRPTTLGVGAAGVGF